MSRLRLLKVHVQPTFVLEDDDGNLSETVAEPIVVSAKDWPTYATEGFPAAIEDLQRQVGATAESGS